MTATTADTDTDTDTEKTAMTAMTSQAPTAPRRLLARVLWTAAVVCVVGVAGTVVGGGPASADEADCVAYMEWAGIAVWEPAHHLMEDACHEGATSHQTHACGPPMKQAIKRHNEETGWPWIAREHAAHACKLAAWY